MNDMQKRFALFLIGCMGARSLLAFTSKKYSNTNFMIFVGLLTMAIGSSFLTIYVNNCRKTGQEVFGDNIWWNNLRPIHAAIYIISSILCFTKYNVHVWKLLTLDVIIGLYGFLLHHYKNNDFSKLIN